MLETWYSYILVCMEGIGIGMYVSSDYCTAGEGHALWYQDKWF